MDTNNATYERYSRQIILKEFGEEGQKKLSQAKVLVVGAGGLGCPVLQYLAGAGLGSIGIMDDDTISISNLHRQTLYSTEDMGLPKALKAAEVLTRLNPDIEIKAFHERLTTANALTILQGYDIIVDGTDNFTTRYMINDACVLLNKPLVYGAVSKFEGQVAIFNAGREKDQPPVNYRDLFPSPPGPDEVQACDEAGVMGFMPGIIGTMMAGETIKLITGMGSPLVNQLLIYNALNNQTRQFDITASDVTRSLIPSDEMTFKQTDYDLLCGSFNMVKEVNARDFDDWISNGDVDIIDVREQQEAPVVSEFDHLHIPLKLLSNNIATIKNNTVIVFCQTGSRSREAVRLLSGIFGQSKTIYSLRGGIVQWKQKQIQQGT